LQRRQARQNCPPTRHGRDPRWTSEAVHALGVTTDVATAGEILGIGRSKAYELARNDELPVRLLRIGRRYIVPVAPVLNLI
jgi:hypothetical protein